MEPVEAVKTGWWPGAGALASKVAMGPHWQPPGPTVGAAGMSPVQSVPEVPEQGLSQPDKNSSSQLCQKIKNKKYPWAVR